MSLPNTNLPIDWPRDLAAGLQRKGKKIEAEIIFAVGLFAWLSICWLHCGLTDFIST